MSLRRRILRLETARKSPATPIPHVRHTRRGETSADAISRFVAQYPATPRGHRFLIDPARDQTPEDDADFDVRFKDQQLMSVANVKSQRPAEIKDLLQ